MNGGSPNSAPAAWLRAARDAEVAGALEDIYAAVAAEIDRRAPACWASGRCCNFDWAGHRLYVTGLEAAYTVARLDRQPTAGAGLSAATLEDALARGGCPFQAANLCGVHAIKPLACRVYFCDRAAQDWQRDLSERMHERVRALHVRFALEYRYAEWRSLLAEFIAPGAAGAAPPGDGPGDDGTAPGLRLTVLRNTDPS